MDSDRTQYRGDLRRWKDELFQGHFDALSGVGRGPVVIVDSTGSTNADVADQVRQGAPAGFTVLAHERVQGRGRLDRTWQSPVGAGITMSIALRPMAPLSQWGWLPLLAGVGVVQACEDVGLAAALKWPNDIVVLGDGDGPRKLGGILVERVDATAEGFGVAAVVGIGLNVDLTVDELPTVLATSFLLEGHVVDRELLATRVLDRVVAVAEQWDQSAGDVRTSGLMDRYRSICSTLGRRVRVERPGGTFLIGTALDIDDGGGLVIKPDVEAPVVVTAGDVVHLRLHESPD